MRNVVNFLIDPGRRRVAGHLGDGRQEHVMGKAMSAVINMDKMVGTDFEQGLANLDAVAKADARSAVGVG